MGLTISKSMLHLLRNNEQNPHKKHEHHSNKKADSDYVYLKTNKNGSVDIEFKDYEEFNTFFSNLNSEIEKLNQRIADLGTLMIDACKEYVHSDNFPYKTGNKYYFFKAGKSNLFEGMDNASGIVVIDEISAVTNKYVNICIKNPENGHREIIVSNYDGKPYRATSVADVKIWSLVDFEEK